MNKSAEICAGIVAGFVLCGTAILWRRHDHKTSVDNTAPTLTVTVLPVVSPVEAPVKVRRPANAVVPTERSATAREMLEAWAASDPPVDKAKANPTCIYGHEFFHRSSVNGRKIVLLMSEADQAQFEEALKTFSERGNCILTQQEATGPSVNIANFAPMRYGQNRFSDEPESEDLTRNGAAIFQPTSCDISEMRADIGLYTSTSTHNSYAGDDTSQDDPYPRYDFRIVNVGSDGSIFDSLTIRCLPSPKVADEDQIGRCQDPRVWAKPRVALTPP